MSKSFSITTCLTTQIQTVQKETRFQPKTCDSGGYYMYSYALRYVQEKNALLKVLLVYNRTVSNQVEFQLSSV